jgi:hypothetical protein
MSDSTRPLGRRPPTDDEHIQKYSLTLQTVPDKPTPVVLGLNWYQNFDSPQNVRVNGRTEWWIGLDKDWGSIRGGHAIVVKPDAVTDTAGWWGFYDQGNEGACVGFSSSRMMSLLNRKRYDAGWLYHEAQRIDEWPGEDYDGTSVRAGMDVLRTEGHRRKFGPLTLPPSLDAGIKENRWATNVVEVLACLHDDVNSDSVILCNSWGKFGYPHYVHLPLDALARLLREDGEATVVVDR